MLDFIIHKNKSLPGWLPENDLALMLTTMQAARSKTYVEIGTLLGKSATAVSQLPFVETVVTVDVFNPSYFKDDSLTKTKAPRTVEEFENLANEYIRQYGQSEKVTVINGKSKDSLPAVENALGGMKIDFLFIDGDHSFDSVYGDYQTYFPLMSPNGIIAVHDVARNAHAGAAKAFTTMYGYHDHRFFLKSPKYGSIGFIYLAKDTTP